MDAILRAMNLMMYGAPPAKEVTAQDDWDYLTTNKPELPGHYYRQGDGVRLAKDHVTIRRDEYEWIPNEKAISELKALMASWRANGWGDLADTVETQYEVDDDGGQIPSPVYESLGMSKHRQKHIKVPLSDVRFYKEMPYDPAKGLAYHVSEPRTNARITGLSTAGLNLD